LQDYKKQHTITVRGRVQEVGFRGYLEDLCKRLRIPSVVYNTAVDELKLLCEADHDTVTKLSAQIKEYRLGEIRELEIKEGLELPFPPIRGVLGIE
jgi:acylphosphatase